jgi:hypothetical protein
MAIGGVTGGSGRTSADTGRTDTLVSVWDQSATVRKSVFALKQHPDPLPSSIGSTPLMKRQSIFSESATVKKPVLYMEQIPEPLPPALWELDFLPENPMNQQPATVKKDAFMFETYPEPAPNTIGEEDMPGGFIKEAVMNGRKSPTYDFVHGIVQIDDVTVLFNAMA